MRVISDVPEVIERLPELVPPTSVTCPPEAGLESFAVLADQRGGYRFERDGSPVTRGIDLDFALLLLADQLRMFVGLKATDRIFVHAGAVSVGNRILLVPGRSFTGKTTLVLALVRAGATYYSDDFALIDADGLVHPYPKPISIRDRSREQIDHAVETFGAVVGTEPLPIGLVAFTQYRSDGVWSPSELSRGRGVLAMLDNTLAARYRSQEALAVLGNALRGAVLLEGDRGEAEAVVDELLARLGGARSVPPQSI